MMIKSHFKTKNNRFEKSHDAENWNRRDPLELLKIHLLQNIKKSEGPFGDIKNVFENFE